MLLRRSQNISFECETEQLYTFYKVDDRLIKFIFILAVKNMIHLLSWMKAILSLREPSLLKVKMHTLKYKSTF